MKIENWNRENGTILRISKNGNIVEDRVIYNTEEIAIKKKLTESQIFKMNQGKDISEFIEQNEGKYIHNIYKYINPYMKELEGNNLDIIRMIVLASYLTFGGKCFDKNNNRIKKSSLKNIWDTSSRNSINLTYIKLLEAEYIYEEEGYIMINEELFVKGKIDNWKQLKKVDNNFTYTRLFSDNIQDMYYSSKETERKRLANFFKILPFINFKYNVLCNNPSEVDETKIQLLNWKELALLCSIDEKNATRLRTDLMKLKIYGHEVIGQFITGSGKAICINPKVFYGGHDIKEVQHLYSMFRMCDKGKKQ